MRVKWIAAALGLLAGCGLSACTTDAQRERDVKGLLRCIQAGKESCLVDLTCTAYPGAFNTEEFLQAIPMLETADVEHLRLVGKDTREDDTVYNFELDGRKLQIRFCPPGYPGSIATVLIEL